MQTELIPKNDLTPIEEWAVNILRIHIRRGIDQGIIPIYQKPNGQPGEMVFNRGDAEEYDEVRQDFEEISKILALDSEQIWQLYNTYA